MLRAFSRYGARVLPNTEQLIAGCRERGELVQGPAIAEFEQVFADRSAGGLAISTSYGRMAFLYILRALGLPPGSEIVFPALTFWVIPEMARVAGYTPVFADVDPETFCLDPDAFERAITPRTRAVVPTHLYGLPCDMDRIVAIAGRHGLRLIEDCAHALGATYRGRPVGTFGDAGFFSFQTLKPLNTYGGGMALVRDPALGRAIAAQAHAEPWPSEGEVMKKLYLGKIQRVFARPRVFSISLFPFLWAGSWVHARPDVYLWESIRPLTPLPEGYKRRYANVQAVIGLEGLRRYFARWTAGSRAHAARLDRTLPCLPGLRVPARPGDREHVFYQYCFYTPDRDEFVRRAIRHRLDVETMHMDVCTALPLFGRPGGAPGAERAARAVQLPVSSSLSVEEMEVVIARIAAVARRDRRATRVAEPGPYEGYRRSSRASRQA